MRDFEQLSVGDSSARAYARAPDDARAGVVVLHAWWGLNDDVLDYADRLADAGYAVLAPDMFGGRVATTIEDAEKLSGASEEAGVDAIVFAAVDALADRLGRQAPLAVVGFSFGAAYALLAPSERERLVASVAYYGSYWGDFLAKSRAPVLGHFAEHDDFEPDENVKALEEAVRSAGREITLYRYPGTGHWFAEPSRDAFRKDAANLAFDRTTEFLARHLRAGVLR
jgi:carboxymethylenebutenolidase